MMDWEFWGFMAASLGGIVLAVGTLIVGGTELDRGFDHRACTAFSGASNRTTKFVEYTYWSWDCLTPTADGKWISTTLLREFAESTGKP